MTGGNHQGKVYSEDFQYYFILKKKLFISSAKTIGDSIAAKCPPLSAAVYLTRLNPFRIYDSGGVGNSRGKRINPNGTLIKPP